MRMKEKSEETEIIPPMAKSAERLLTIIEALERPEGAVSGEPPTMPHAGFNPALFPLLEECASISRKLKSMAGGTIPEEILTMAKASGFSDVRIARLIGSEAEKIRRERKQAGIQPSLKPVAPPELAIN